MIKLCPRLLVKTVAGETWLNAYIETLKKEELSTSDVKFKFGDGEEVLSRKGC